MPPIGVYGMTEVSGIATMYSYKHSKAFTSGFPLPGVQFKIDNPDKEGIGEICMKGRSCFLGYYKNEKATSEVYDSDGYVHSGDLGVIKDGFLEITGRIKELIITAGGENIPPVVIENTFKEVCPIISNVMVVGDNKNYLTALITLKVNANPNDNEMTLELSKECLAQIKIILDNEFNESKIKTVTDIATHPKIIKYLNSCLEEANEKAISRAQHIRKYTIIEYDFSISGGELTPSLKLKRKVVEKKY